MQKPVTTYYIMDAFRRGDGPTMLRPGAVIEDIRAGAKSRGRPAVKVKTCPVGKAGMALYSITREEKARLKKLGLG